ncbi:MAG: hypothetical protein RMK29_10395 [Myxococcales bacterium]|nr:hypothetical protein [Myxococcales bacterium]
MRGWLLVLLLGSCSFTFDGSEPDVVLVGEPPDMSRLPRLNRAPVDDAYVVRGHDGAYWTAILELGDLLRVRRLSDPPQEEEFRVKNPIIRWRAFFFVEPDANPERPTRVTIRAAGEPGPGAQFLMPPGPAQIMTGGPEDVFLYWVTRPTTTHFDVVRRDGSFRRRIPVPRGVDPTRPLDKGGFFDATGRRLLVRDGEGRVTLYSTVDEQDRDLGVRPRRMVLLPRERLLTCGEDGLRVVPLAGGDDLVLDRDACQGNSLWTSGDSVFYTVGDHMRRVPLDGSAPPQVVFEGGGRQLLLIGPEGELVYSLDPPGRWAHNASDGWLGDWRFMLRGRHVNFSFDGRRLRWLEHAATLNGAGDLLSAEVPGGEPLRLARNVTRYAELADGRVLAISNAAFWGTQNRIIVIDETTRTAQWVADSASAFLYVPGTRDLLVFVTTGGHSFDLVRVTIPRRLSPPAR